MQAVAQKAFAQRAPVARASGRAARNTRAVAVCASSDQARQVFSGVLAAGVASLVAANAAFANVASPIDVFDDRKARDTGFDLIYEARDLDLPQSSRDGLDQFRGNLDATKQRVKDAEARIDSLLEPSIKKAYWTEAREELRRQVGTLRFDLNTLAETKAKGEKKAAQSLKKEFIAKVEALDFALRQKDQASATKALEATKGALDSVLAAVL